MKQFIKTTFATVVGLIIFGFISFLFLIFLFGAIASFGSTEAEIPTDGILELDMSEFVVKEQAEEMDPLSLLSSKQGIASEVGIRSAVNAIKAAAEDPGVRFIYLKPDLTMCGTTTLEELRKALTEFRKSGKAVISCLETPTNAGYYLASVSDKIYMYDYDGSMNLLTGLSSQMMFIKDLLDALGVEVQLIRHGKYKSAGEMFVRNSSSKENLHQNQVLVNSLWSSISSAVAESRNITVEEFNRVINDLELQTPQDFIDNKLADELVTKESLKDCLTELYLAEDYDDVKFIPFADYAKKQTNVNLKAENKVAIIYADGDIVDGDKDSQVAGDKFAKIICDIRKDTTIKAVVLRVNSPGGSVVASAKIKTELDLLAEQATIVASYGDYAASGGYWISANADYIYSNAMTLTGSIGVFSMIPNAGDAVRNKLKINITSVNSNEHSDMYSLTHRLDAAEVAYMQESVEIIYDRFTSIVAEGRDMEKSAVDEIAQGRVWSGADAIEIGLVDEIGTLEDALRYAATSIEGVNDINEVQVVEYPKPLSAAEKLMKSLNVRASLLKGTGLEDIEAAFGNWNDTMSGKVYARMPYEFIIK